MEIIKITVTDMKLCSHLKLTLGGMLFAIPVLALLLAGCGDSAPVANSDTTSDPVQQKVVLYTWTDYLEPEVLEAFTEETGIEVDYQNCEATGELKAMLESAPGEYDVVIADEVTMAELIDLKLIRQLDHEQLPLMSHLDERYMDLDFDKGNQYTLPYMPGSTIFAYRSDLFEPKEESWNVFWDERLRGKVMMLDEMEEVFAVGLLREGHSLNSQDPEEVQGALASLSEAVQKNAIEFGGVYENLERLLNGEIWAMHCYNGDAASLRDGLMPFSDGPAENIAFFTPKEGARLWVDSFALARESTRTEAAHKLINYMLRPEVAAANSNYLWLGTPNKAALEHLDPDLLAEPAIFPPAEVKEKCELLTSTTAEHERIMLEGMSDLLSLSRQERASQELQVQADTTAVGTGAE